MNRPAALLRDLWERVAIYLPIILISVLALGSYWLVRNTPFFGVPPPEPPVRHDPDYFMHNFAVKTFDGTGRLKSELFGTEGHHYPDTDTLEISNARIRSVAPDGRITVATANRALSNSDASEVELFGNAIVVREATAVLPQMEFRGEFLHAYTQSERVSSNKPVTLIRGNDQFAGDSMDYDNASGVMHLNGRVKGLLEPEAAKPAH